MKWWFRWLALSLVFFLLPLVAQAQPPTGEAEISGKITGIDLQNNQITISDGEKVTIKIAEWTRIKVWGKKPATI